MPMRVTCAVCKKNTKVYIGSVLLNDNTSWVCGPCYNSTKMRETNLKDTVDVLNDTITRLRAELSNIPKVFHNFGQPGSDPFFG